jgi:hypothetical protein
MSEDKPVEKELSKIDLNAQQRQRLLTLFEQAEKAQDAAGEAPSAEELDQLESKLDQRLAKLIAQREKTAQRSDGVLPLARRRFSALQYSSLALIAAVFLGAILYVKSSTPSILNNSEADLTYKGVSGAAKVDCEVEFYAENGSKPEFNAARNLYTTGPQHPLHATLSCSRNVYLHYSLKSNEREIQRAMNIKIAGDERQPLLKSAADEQLLTLSVPSVGDSLKLALFVTQEPLPENAPLPLNAETATDQTNPFLWSDQFEFR